jgi:opacity protein-like surface antigen
MKKILFATSALILLSAGAAVADTISDNMYVSVLGGWSFDPHLRYGTNTPAMNTGFNAGARLGVNLDPWIPSVPGLSFEVDDFYNQSHYGTSQAGAKLSSASFMGNLIYHVPLAINPNLSLYGGGGAGAVDDMLSGPIHGSQTVFGWQAIGGLEYAVSPDMSLFTEYRYQNAHDANISGLTNVGNTSNNVSVGVKFGL